MIGSWQFASIQPGISALHALQISQGVTPRWQFGLLDEHVGDIVLDGEAGAAPSTDQSVTLATQSGMAKGTDKKR
jgi:hypothetical protein